jgi:uncharacterized protein (TIGR03435 family)
MRKVIISASLLILGCGSACSQESDIRFEVASVRAAGVPQNGPGRLRMSGGPGTADPERITYPNVTLKNILSKAYGVENDRISGPSWLDSERYDIAAKVPPGATKEQLNAMLRNLLVERFNLAIHHETKVVAVYELTVAKTGPTLTEADMDAPPAPVIEPGSRPPTIGTDSAGFLQVPPGRPMMLGRMTDGIMRWTAKVQTLASLTSFLGGELQRPVVDKTGLTGKYDFKLAYSRDGLRPMGPAAAPGIPVDDTPSGGPSLQRALQDQLGLRLESAKDPIEFLVIDHIDKVPTEN